MTRRKMDNVESSRQMMAYSKREAILLQGELAALDLMKRRMVHSTAFEQRILFQRIRTKLRQSELAHARLTGRSDRVKQLKTSTPYHFNTTVTDDSEEAVREILTRSMGRYSGTARSNRTITPLSLWSEECTTREKGVGQYRRPESKGGSKLGVMGSIEERDGKGEMDRVCVLKPRSGDSVVIATEGGLQRPYTAAEQGPTFNWVTVEEKGRTSGRDTTARVKSVGFNVNASERKRFDRATSLDGCWSSGERKDESGSRSVLDIFLNISQAESNEEKRLAQTRARLARQADLDARVKSFIGRIKAAHEESSELHSQHSPARPQQPPRTDAGRWRELEGDRAGWNLVGGEANHRSITCKKLDLDFVFVQRDIPPEMLLLESYNEVLTKENLRLRNWINNNPYKQQPQQITFVHRLSRREDVPRLSTLKDLDPSKGLEAGGPEGREGLWDGVPESGGREAESPAADGGAGQAETWSR